jgi:hypothetical protein
LPSDGLQLAGPLLAVIVGALSSYLAVTLSERGKWRRETSVRWHGEQLTAYAEYGDVVKRVKSAALRVARSKGLESTAPPIDLAQGLENLIKLEDERTAKWERVLLLGDPETVLAAREWHRSVWKIQDFARGEDVEREAWPDFLRQTTMARARFYACARKQLGISGELPRSSDSADLGKPNW